MTVYGLSEHETTRDQVRLTHSHKFQTPQLTRAWPNVECLDLNYIRSLRNPRLTRHPTNVPQAMTHTFCKLASKLCAPTSITWAGCLHPFQSLSISGWSMPVVEMGPKEYWYLFPKSGSTEHPSSEMNSCHWDHPTHFFCSQSAYTEFC